MDTPFVPEQVYEAPNGKQWQALTDKDQMKECYFPQMFFKCCHIARPLALAAIKKGNKRDY